MKIIRATADNVLAASQIIKRGGVVVYPTDTVYGLGCDPFNIEAVRRIFEVKGEREKPLPVLVSGIELVEKIAHLSDRARNLAEKFWPGPLTLVVPKKQALPDVVTRGLDSVGVRMPCHDVAMELTRLSNGFLIGTSANKTGRKSSQTAQEAAEQIGEKVDLILDGGATPLGMGSTVVDLTSGKLRVLREGPIGLEEISAILFH